MVLKSASGTVSGTYEIVYPTGTRAYVTSTTIWNSQSTVTTTLVKASGNQIGTVLVEMPAGYTTTTINSGTASTPITTTIQTASGTATGIVEVIYSEGYTTVYTNIPSNSAAYTTTVAAQNPTAPGTVVVGQPSKYTTVTTLSGTVSSTTTVQPSAPAQGTVVVENPAASQAACNNQGMQWAYWNNTQGANGANDNGVTDGYTIFDPTVYKNQDPWYNATTPGSGGINNPSTNVAIPISIYGVPGFVADYFALGQKGYIYAEQTGNYNFTIAGVDDWLGIWLGPNAQSGWTKQNTNFQVGYVSSAGKGSFTYAATKGQYIPFRMVFGQAQGAAVFNVSLTAPNGALVAGPTTSYTSDVVQFGCGNDINQAPYFSGWGNEA